MGIQDHVEVQNNLAEKSQVQLGDDAAEKASKVAITQIKKAHSAWDRDRRDLAIIVEKSKGNDNTCGCRVQKQLEESLENGNALDEELLDCERSTKHGHVLSTKEILRSSEAAKELAELIKNAKKKGAALKGMFSV